MRSHTRTILGSAILLVLIVLGVCACAAGPRSASSPIVQSWDYAADRAAVYAAVVGAARELGFSIAEANEARGQVRTTWRSFPATAGYADCPSGYEGRVSFRLGEGVQGVRVTMDAEYRAPGEGSSEGCVSSGVLERELNRRILEVLSR